MNIFEKLSVHERAMIQQYIEVNAGYDCDGVEMTASLEHILRFWNKNKENLCRVLGGELIRTKKVAVAKPQRMIEDEISHILYSWDAPGRTFYNQFLNWIRSHEERYRLDELLQISELSTNIYSGASFSIVDPDGHKIDINTGCKVSKVLGKIARAFNIAGYEEFRIAHSQILNQKKLSGELCVSIHPLDYMTMSDNNCGWSSCMSWQDCGDYRQGTVEMMNSACIVVAYLKSNENMEIPFGNEWNSKKWRQLFIVTPEIVVGIRQYPYNNDELNGLTLQWLRDLAQVNAGWGPYMDTAVIVKNHEDFPVAALDKTFNFRFTTRFMYNDFYSEHLAYLNPEIPVDYQLCFSGESECMTCGCEVSHDTSHCTSALQCYECDDAFFCAECGERISISDCVTLPDGTRVCEYCYNEYWKECNICGETYHESSMDFIYLRVGEAVTSYSIRVCERCLEDDNFEKRYGNWVAVPWGRWDERRVVDLENFENIDVLDDFDVWHSGDREEYEAFYERLKAEADNDAEAESSDEI